MNGDTYKHVDAGASPAQEDIPSAMPAGMILGYMSRENSPTRVRRVAATCCIWIGIVAAVVIVAVGARIAQEAQQFRATPRWIFPPLLAPPARGRPWAMPVAVPPSWFDVARFVIHAESALLVVFASFAPSVILLFLAGLIRRGQRIPAYLAMAAVYLLFPFLFISITVLFCWGILAAAIHPASYDLPQLLWTLVLPPGMLLILLLLDLGRYLRWIARHPLEEKAPVTFLPGIAVR